MKEGSTFIDVGCGNGFFSLPAARIVGKHGRVYGVDVSSDVITELKAEAKREGVKNLILRVGRAEETIFCNACADIVFYGVVLHDFKDPNRALVNARKMVKQDGRLINLDWRKEPMPIGPPLSIRFDEDMASRLIAQAGFRVTGIKQVLPYSYLIVAVPK